MATHGFGEIIKGMREKADLSQTMLAGEYMDRGYLSKIERGIITPTKETLEYLFERLGYNPTFLADYLINDESARIQKMKNEINVHFRRERFAEAEKLLQQFKNDDQFMSKKFSSQYISLYEAALIVDPKRTSERLELLMEALKISIPVFRVEDLGKKYLLNKQEIRIINLIGVAYHDLDRLDDAIELMQQLMANYDRRFIDASFKGTHYPVVIYNLTKYLGMVGRYDEAIRICLIGEETCFDLGAFRMLPEIVFNRACCILERDGDKETFVRLMRECYYTFGLYRKFEDQEITKAYVKEKTNIDL